MDEVLAHIREAVGEETMVIVMSDHGFAPYHRKFNLNTWLLENGYLTLKDGESKELPEDHADYKRVNILTAVDWSRTRAYGIGFNGLYLNLKGRESQGIVEPGAAAEALLAELARELEAVRDDSVSHQDVPVVLAAELASKIYTGERSSEAPDLIVGYNSGYGNSDEGALGQVSHDILADNLGGTFNGSHLMDPRVVAGTLLTNARIALADPRLEDLTVEILRIYGIEPEPEMDGRPVFERNP
jgi:predicted AlkP superfamily phosphohydrolase/phosphomutase